LNPNINQMRVIKTKDTKDNHIKFGEAVAEWEQRWCRAIVLSEEEFKALKKSCLNFQV
jgi:hypothetical protein